MMSAIPTRRKPRSSPSDATASRPMSREYDDNKLRTEQTLEQVLPGQDRASRWVDIDETEESDAAGLLELDSSELIADDITVAIIPKRADEFTCSNCFLIHHISRLATSKDGQPVCTDCT